MLAFPSFERPAGGGSSTCAGRPQVRRVLDRCSSGRLYFNPARDWLVGQAGTPVGGHHGRYPTAFPNTQIESGFYSISFISKNHRSQYNFSTLISIARILKIRSSFYNIRDIYQEAIIYNVIF